MHDQPKTKFLIVERHERMVSATVEAANKDEALARYKAKHPSVAILDNVVDQKTSMILLTIPL